MSAGIGSHRARSCLGRFTWVRYCVDYVLLLCWSRVGWFTRAVRCTIYATLFLLRSYFGTLHWYLHGQGSGSGHAVIYTGRYLLWWPMSTISAHLMYCCLLCILLISWQYGTVSRPIRNLREHLSSGAKVYFYSSWSWCSPRATLVRYFYVYFLLTYTSIHLY